MADDWPDEGKKAACEAATVWREVFIGHRRDGDDDAWAAHLADIALERFMKKVLREAREDSD